MTFRRPLRRHLTGWLPLAAALALLAAPPPGAAMGSLDVQSLEACAARKLEAAGAYCAQALRGRAIPGAGRERVLEAAFARLERKFAKADGTPLASGGECAASTGEADPVRAQVEAAAAGVTGAGPGRSGRGQPLEAAASLCRDLLQAEAAHLRQRADDRAREGLAAEREEARTRFDRRASSGKRSRGDAGAVAERVEELVADLVGHVAVSPRVSPDWEMIEPPEVVSYRGRELRPTCWDGDPWVMFTRKGTVNKLVVYYQGGGACWNDLTCTGLPGLVGPTFKQSTGPGDDPSRYTTGFADLDDPENPFRDWHAVFVPYCTGDIHWGDAVVEYENTAGEPVTVRHKGFVNAQVAEKFAREHFVHPEQVFVTGSSAGAYGAIVNSLHLQEFAYPSADFSVVGDGGNGVITQEFLVEDLAKWGIEKNLPEWMPGLNRPLGELQASDLYIEAAKTYPHNRFASYTTAYDGGQGGQVGFYQIMRSGPNVLEWPRWWVPSCEWNERMLALNEEAAQVAPNFRYYVGTGSRHTMWGSDKVYHDTTGGVPTVRDWLAAMLGETPDWTNVVAEDFGLLLPGDPRPSPGAPLASPPFDPYDLEAGRVVCEE